jgi:hypothetical protein
MWAPQLMHGVNALCPDITVFMLLLLLLLLLYCCRT